jgi:hypothetical protein
VRVDTQITTETVNMASMIEHSKFVSMHHMKQEWEDEMVKEDDEKIKAGSILLGLLICWARESLFS